MLLSRARATLPVALERMAGLQAQYAPSMYIGLWSRVEGFERSRLDAALMRRSVVQGTLMRSTIHLVSRRDYWPFAVAGRRARREWWLRTTKGSAVELERAAERLRARLAEGPVERKELDQIAGKGRTGGLGLWVDMVRVPPSGTWEQRKADLYGLADTWVRPAAVTESAGLEHVVRRYLGAFGPATVREIADWAGIPNTTLSPAIHRLSLRQFRDEKGKELLDLQRAPLPDAATPAPVRFLPTWDATLLVHARRTEILLEQYRPLVFNTKTPHSVPTFLVDGAVAGTWRYEGGRIEVKPFEPLPKAARREVEDEAKRLAAFHK